MSENGIRQDGPPHIAPCAEQQQLEPVHYEINAWQHVSNIIYRETVQRGVFLKFIDALSSSAVGNRTDQENVTEKPRVAVSHADGSGEPSTKLDFLNASNTKFVGQLSQAV